MKFCNVIRRGTLGVFPGPFSGAPWTWLKARCALPTQPAEGTLLTSDPSIMVNSMSQARDQEAKANVIAGYAACGAWLGMVLHLCGLREHVGTINASMVLAGLGAVVGIYRMRRMARFGK